MVARRHAAGLDYAPSDLELSLLRISSGSVCPSLIPSVSLPRVLGRNGPAHLSIAVLKWDGSWRAWDIQHGM